MRKIITMMFFVVLFVILVISIIEMPTESSIHAPSYNDTVHYYLDHGLEETGASNIIAAILADYRGFDTLGETIVLFTSIVAVASVLRTTKKKDEKEDQDHE
ncbi:MAG: hypothetical protein IH571_00770 [Acholeplasmataceae bacterium]|nr:hypothetical protein [Acholeplasmataceae bacterium]